MQNKMKKTPYKNYMLYFIVLLLIVIVGCSGDMKLLKRDETGQSETTQSVPSTMNAHTTFAIGDEIKVGDFIVRLSNKREVESYGFDDHANIRAAFVVFDVEVEARRDTKNFTTTVKGMNDVSTNIRDRYVLAENRYNVLERFSSLDIKELDKGRKAKGYVAFQVSEHVKQVKLSASPFHNRNIIVNL